ncbi:MAG TPA: HPF/RaiA family ribosome-associated protein [Noviherbaspirillum sp.]|nr:HPF/RaiA family ribosome-associated protein [Noviherbaspirillum sp.]
MDVQMVTQEFSLTPSLREHLRRRVRFAFGRARDRVMRVVVRLRDLNGPRGGQDKVCQVSVTIPGNPDVVVRAVHADMYAAIDRAVKRAAYSAMRSAARRRRENHHG